MIRVPQHIFVAQILIAVMSAVFFWPAIYPAGASTIDASRFLTAGAEDHFIPLTNPAITGINPLSNTHTAPLTAPVWITYDQPISAATVSTQTFAVHAMQTGQLTQTYSVNGGQILLTPHQPFNPGELVQVSATTGTLTVGGQPPISSTVWQFRTNVSDGSGLVFDSGQRLGFHNSWAVALGDLDGDGDLDAFVSNRTLQGSQVWLNDGAGFFIDSGQSLGTLDSEAMKLGDLDGDGDLDAFIGNTGGQGNEVWLNDSTGVFTDSGQSLGSSDSVAVSLGDLDGDGDLDAFIGNWTNQPNKVWLNDGAGFFTDSGQSLGMLQSRAVPLGDLDGDGDLDAFVGNNGQPSKVWLNDGHGNFSDSGQNLNNPAPALSVALGDLDSDGDLDAIIANGESGNLWTNPILLNDGTGVFTDSGNSVGGSYSYAVSFGDMDGDTDLDVFVGNTLSQTNKIWLNDGTGSFIDNGQNLGTSSTQGVALGDVDGDGDLDVFVGNGYDQANEVWLNQVPPGLTISKTGPAQVTIGSPITYTLTLTNSGEIGVSNLVITDAIPNGATYVTGGTKVGSVVSWTLASLAGNSTVQVSFGVTAASTIVNRDYRVLAAGNITATAQKVVTTTVSAVPLGQVTITGPGGSIASDNSYDFTANVTPVTATVPLTYVWQVTDHASVVHTGNSLSNSQTFSWSTAGAKTITVTVTNQANSVTASQVVAINGMPLASNLQISPPYPTINDNLVLSYTYSDPNGDPEGNSQIRWYRGGVIQSSYNNSLTIPGTATLEFEQWCATVEPHDGTLFGAVTQQKCVTIQPPNNRLPEASSVVIAPAAPLDNSDLTLTYVYTDADGDSEGNSKIQWSSDGTLQPAFNDKLVVGRAATILNQIWCAVVTPYDGTEYGATVQSNCVVIGSGNQPPQVLNFKLQPPNPTSDDSLTVSYQYSDPEGNPETTSKREIRWYRNGELQPIGNNQLTLASTSTIPGQTWHATIRVFDGQTYSLLAQTTPVFISDPAKNSPPAVDNVRLTRTEPDVNDDLQLTYDFLDVDGNPDKTTQIYWYKSNNATTGSEHQKIYNGSKTIPATATQVGDVWYAAVIPDDGQDEGDLEFTHSVAIKSAQGNSPPEARQVQLCPSQASTDSHLQLKYLFDDPDLDAQGATTIRWTVTVAGNSVPQPAYDDWTVIPSDITTEGETWQAVVTPNDGKTDGQPVQTNPATILSSRKNLSPTVTNVYITPAHPAPAQSMSVKYEYIDQDCNNENDTAIRWYKKKDSGWEQQSKFNNLRDIPGTATQSGEEWYVSVQPNDGESYGNEILSPPVIINTLPVYTKSVTIIPSEPTVYQGLTIESLDSYHDDDGDPPHAPRVFWYKDNNLVAGLENELVPPSVVTPAGSVWYAAVKPFDGTDYGVVQTTTTSVKLLPINGISTDVYLPIVMHDEGPLPCTAETFYEENDNRAQSENFGCELVSGVWYEPIYPDDNEDIFYFDLEETSSVKIEVVDYYTQGGSGDRNKQGQLLLYNAIQPNESIASERHLQGSGAIPNNSNPNAGRNLVGRHYVRVYTYNGTFQTATPYKIRLVVLD